MLKTFSGITRDLDELVRHPGEIGRTRRRIGRETAEVSVEIDIETIARRLGARAMANRSGTAKYLDGLIVVRVRNRVKTLDKGVAP